MGKQWKQWQTIVLGPKINADGDCSYVIKRCLLLGRKLWQSILSSIPRQCIKQQRHYFANKGPSSYGFSSSHVWIWELDHKEGWVLKNWCFRTVVLKTPESPLDFQSILKEINTDIHWKDWCWSSNTLATWCEEQTDWKRPWCWKRLRAGGEGGDRGWDGWMLSSTQWTWVWANSRRQWRAGKPGVLQPMESQRVGQDGATEQQIVLPVPHVNVYWRKTILWHSTSTISLQTEKIFVYKWKNICI